MIIIFEKNNDLLTLLASEKLIKDNRFVQTTDEMMSPAAKFRAFELENFVDQVSPSGGIHFYEFLTSVGSCPAESKEAGIRCPIGRTCVVWDLGF